MQTDSAHQQTEGETFTSKPVYWAAAQLPIALALAFTAASARAEIKGDVLRIGVLTDMSGVFATVKGSVEAGQRTHEPWFFITADYAYGHAVEADARARLARVGGNPGFDEAQPLFHRASAYDAYIGAGGGGRVRAVQPVLSTGF